MPSKRNREYREEEYEVESLMIGKMLQEVEDSTNDKERRAEIRRKKRQVVQKWKDRAFHY